MSALSTFLPFGGGNYAHQVGGDSDKTWAHFKWCIKDPFWFLMKPYFSRWTISWEEVVAHSVHLLYFLQIDPIMETSRATKVRNMAQLERARRTQKIKIVEVINK